MRERGSERVREGLRGGERGGEKGGVSVRDRVSVVLRRCAYPSHQRSDYYQILPHTLQATPALTPIPTLILTPTLPLPLPQQHPWNISTARPLYRHHHRPTSYDPHHTCMRLLEAKRSWPSWLMTMLLMLVLRLHCCYHYHDCCYCCCCYCCYCCYCCQQLHGPYTVDNALKKSSHLCMPNDRFFV